MRYPPDQKAKARAALIDAGARALKTAGFKGIGVDGLAAAAGMTSGAFYSNFANKEELLEAVVDAFVGEPFLSDTATGAVAEKRARLLGFLDEYISTGHSAGPASVCVMPALSADVSRAQPPVKQAFERKIGMLTHRVAGLLEGKRSEREQRAWSIVALMVGAVTVSRAMTEHGEARTAAITAAHRTAVALVG